MDVVWSHGWTRRILVLEDFGVNGLRMHIEARSQPLVLHLRYLSQDLSRGSGICQSSQAGGQAVRSTYLLSLPSSVEITNTWQLIQLFQTSTEHRTQGPQACTANTLPTLNHRSFCSKVNCIFPYVKICLLKNSGSELIFYVHCFLKMISFNCHYMYLLDLCV